MFNLLSLSLKDIAKITLLCDTTKYFNAFMRYFNFNLQITLIIYISSYKNALKSYFLYFFFVGSKIIYIFATDFQHINVLYNI